MEFYELLEKLCDNGNSFVKYETVILGDFNTNVQNMSDVSPLLNSIKHFMQICGLKQLIEEPTRITATSESILDLIIVSDKDKIIQSGVLDIGLSDHVIVYCTHKIKKSPINKLSALDL